MFSFKFMTYWSAYSSSSSLLIKLFDQNKDEKRKNENLFQRLSTHLWQRCITESSGTFFTDAYNTRCSLRVSLSQKQLSCRQSPMSLHKLLLFKTFIVLPLNLTWPVSGIRSLVISLKIVVLPEPEGPFLSCKIK